MTDQNNPPAPVAGDTGADAGPVATVFLKDNGKYGIMWLRPVPFVDGKAALFVGDANGDSGICHECGKKSSDGWALYCVACMEKAGLIAAPSSEEPQIFAANEIVAAQWGVDPMTPFIRLMDKATWDAMCDSYKAAPADAVAIGAADDLPNLVKVAEDFDDCCDTDIEYKTLMRLARRGWLECVRFEVTAAGRAAIAATQEAPQ